MKESRQTDPVELHKARLGLLRIELFRLLKSLNCQTLKNLQTGRLFYERVHTNERLGFRISTPIQTLNSLPAPDQTLVIVLTKVIPQPTVIVVPPESYETVEIAAGRLRQRRSFNNTIYLPTHPEEIKRIVALKNLKPRSLSFANLDILLDYLTNLKR